MPSQLGWWIETGLNEFATLNEALHCIQLEEHHSGSAFRSQSDDRGAIESKMLGPVLSAWIEQCSQITRQRIDRTDITTFATIT